MDRGAWRSVVHGVTSVGHDLATKQQLLKIQKIPYFDTSKIIEVFFKKNEYNYI